MNDEWLPIESAPKDRTPILAFVSKEWIEGMLWNGSDGDITLTVVVNLPTGCRFPILPKIFSKHERFRNDMPTRYCLCHC